MTDITSIRIPEELKKRINQRYPSLDFSKSFCKLAWDFFKLEERFVNLKNKYEEKNKTIEWMRQGDSQGIFREGCISLDYDRNGKPMCRNKKAPIDTRDLTPKACKYCSAYQSSKSNVPKANLGRTSVREKKEHRIPEQRISEEPRHLFNRESDRIYCPHKEERIDKSGCTLCKRLRWNTWRSCQEMRRRTPNDPMFHPKQNVVN